MKGPKKVVSAFLHYSKEVRETIRSTSDFAKKSGESWKTLPEDKKQKYRIKEQKDKERSLKEKRRMETIKTSTTTISEKQQLQSKQPISTNELPILQLIQKKTQNDSSILEQ